MEESKGCLLIIILGPELEERLLEMLRNRNHNVSDPAGKCQHLDAGLYRGGMS